MYSNSASPKNWPNKQYAGLVLYYLTDKTCNLENSFLVFYQMGRKNHWDIFCSFLPRNRHHRSKILLEKQNVLYHTRSSCILNVILFNLWKKVKTNGGIWFFKKFNRTTNSKDDATYSKQLFVMNTAMYLLTRGQQPSTTTEVPHFQ